jgi:hypothetical protein
MAKLKPKGIWGRVGGFWGKLEWKEQFQLLFTLTIPIEQKMEQEYPWYGLHKTCYIISERIKLPSKHVDLYEVKFIFLWQGDRSTMTCAEKYQVLEKARQIPSKSS